MNEMRKLMEAIEQINEMPPRTKARRMTKAAPPKTQSTPDRKLDNAIRRGVQQVWDEGFDTEDAEYAISSAIIRSVRKAGY